jgi:ribosomal protein S27AE
MAIFTVTIPGRIPPELAEELEDSLAVILGAMGFSGTIDDSETGNTTVFPIEDLSMVIYDMLDQAIDKITKPEPILCPNCGSDEVCTAEDDEEMRECGNCNHLWEIDNESQDF